MELLQQFFVALICLPAVFPLGTEVAPPRDQLPVSLGEMSITQEITVYAGENLTMTCQVKGSPTNFVYWYKYEMDNDSVKQMHLHTGPSHTISMATIQDTALYYCSSTEWGIWGISRYIIVNVIEPGKPSCANGWSLHKNSCYMYYDKQLDTEWNRANDYCGTVSGAYLVKILDDSDMNFTCHLMKKRKGTSFWTGLPRDANGSLHWSDGSLVREGCDVQTHHIRNKIEDKRDNCAALLHNSISRKSLHCTRKLPFICQRDLPEAPQNITIEDKNSSSARVVWQPISYAFNAKTTAYFIECTTHLGKLVSLTSSVTLSSLLSNLRPSTQYRVRVQAGNIAGNGSYSPYVTFSTRDRAPKIKTLPPDGVVITGRSVTLTCGNSTQKITWYKDSSKEPIHTGQSLDIYNATTKDEGSYHCTVNDGDRDSVNITVIEPPLIIGLTGAFLKESLRSVEPFTALLECTTANRHPLKYAWNRDGVTLPSRDRQLKVPLKTNEAFGRYECKVSNLAGAAYKSILISPLGKTDDKYASSLLIELLAIIGGLSLVLMLCVANIVYRNMSLRRKTKKRSRKYAVRNSSIEIEAIELGTSLSVESRDVESPSGNVTEGNDDVFPYDVIVAWTGASPEYMSLRRDNVCGDHVHVTQIRPPDYTNISPSNRNDSAANCMYAPLKLTQNSHSGQKNRKYENMDASASTGNDH